MNKTEMAELGREIRADQTSLSAEMRKTAPDYDLVITLANAIKDAASKIEFSAMTEQNRLRVLAVNWAEIMPQLLGEKAAN